MKVLVFLGGQYDEKFIKHEIELQPDAKIICADSGAEIIRQVNKKYNLSVRPALIAGDFDSLSVATKKEFQKKGVPTKLKLTQDITDSEFAVQNALEFKPDEIILYGALGNRRDHEYANLMLLEQLLNKGIIAKLRDVDTEIFLVNKTNNIIGKAGDIISLQPLSECVSGIKVSGLKWAPKNSELYRAKTAGISNIMTADIAEVCISKGVLMVIHTSKRCS